ncbi:MAG TPA: hypothetical protein VM942_02100 [Acidimicrobiales bacterium]|nr:hypothetical protein [Acidimicrobiales bacterium]
MADPVAPPAPDEVELSAFGPGYGESLLVHLGAGEWMMVDSCVKAGRLPALDYLASIGVDPALSVTRLVATHWHDDHVRGLSEALFRCSGATFVCSVAVNVDELLALVDRKPRVDFGKVTSGVDEMRNVRRHLDAAGERHRLTWANSQKTLYERRGDLPCRIVALAPCEMAVSEAFLRIAELVVDTAPTRRVPKPERNDGAVVLWVEVGDATILLGADLQETEDDHTGWTAVVLCRDGDDRKSEIFKVPHHGSSNGHSEPVWRDLLVDNPEAVVCPHERGRNQLPTKDDLDRLCQRARVHLTAPPRPATSSTRGRRRGRLAEVDFGRVTLRRRIGEGADWNVTYDPPARFGCTGASPDEGAPGSVAVRPGPGAGEPEPS